MRSKGDGIQPRTLFYFAKLAGIQIEARKTGHRAQANPPREGLRVLRV
jgi:hypothetical protein